MAEHCSDINSFTVFLHSKQLQKLVVENVLAFNEGFWIRLAARTETCKSEDDKARFRTWSLFMFMYSRHSIYFS